LLDFDGPDELGEGRLARQVEGKEFPCSSLAEAPLCGGVVDDDGGAG
jgi:hypothetical protein